MGMLPSAADAAPRTLQTRACTWLPACVRADVHHEARGQRLGGALLEDHEITGVDAAEHDVELGAGVGGDRPDRDRAARRRALAREHGRVQAVQQVRVGGLAGRREEVARVVAVEQAGVPRTLRCMNVFLKRSDQGPRESTLLALMFGNRPRN
jgi:hypothetical protein